MREEEEAAEWLEPEILAELRDKLNPRGECRVGKTNECQTTSDFLLSHQIY
jgi:hypothetical protein